MTLNLNNAFGDIFTKVRQGVRFTKAGKPPECAMPVAKPFVAPESSKEIGKWGKRVEKLGDDFADKFGLGPCGPVADNIVGELQRQGITARVMFTEYAHIHPITGQQTSFAHYVAVQMEKGKVVRIFDPTNPYAMPARWVTEGKIPTEYTSISHEIFGKVGRSVDDDVFTKEMVNWWRNKL